MRFIIDGTPVYRQVHRSSIKSVSSSVRLANVGVHKVVFETSKRLRCEVGSKKGIQSRSASKCQYCNVHLCSKPSKNYFNIFHES